MQPADEVPKSNTQTESAVIGLARQALKKEIDEIEKEFGMLVAFVSIVSFIGFRALVYFYPDLMGTTDEAKTDLDSLAYVVPSVIIGLAYWQGLNVKKTRIAKAKEVFKGVLDE